MSKFKNKPRNLSPEDRQRVIDAIKKRSEPNAALQYQWIRNCALTTAYLLKNGPNGCGVATTFWIRLDGTITELFKSYQDFDDTLLEVGQCPVDGWIDCKAVYEAYKPLKALRDALTDDEVILIDRMRQLECHVTQSGFSLRVMNDGKVKDTRKVPALNKEVPVDEIERCIEAYKAGRSEDEVITALADKLWPYIRDAYLGVRSVSGRPKPTGPSDFFS